MPLFSRHRFHGLAQWTGGCIGRSNRACSRRRFTAILAPVKFRSEAQLSPASRIKLPVVATLGVDHIGLTVPNVETATEFFQELFGAEVLFDVGPFEHADDWMRAHLGVDPRAKIKVLRMLKLAHGPCLELFEYEAPAQQRNVPANSDIGGHHLAFYVENMDKAVAALRGRGVEVMGEPTVIKDGPSEGLSWVYVRAPWGLQLELVSYPRGLRAYRDKKINVWRPRPE